MIPPSRSTIGVAHKSFPPHLWGGSAAALDEPLSAFATPLLTLDAAAIEHNTAVMVGWAAQYGVHLAPHGKTTMAPQLWRLLLDAEAWGLTLATPWQAQVAHAHGIRDVILPSPILDPGARRWIVGAADEGLRLRCWADSEAAVEAMATMAGGSSLPVLVELGGAGGRTGARSVDDALRVARAIERAPGLHLAGVAGYEGALAHDRSDAALSTLTAYLDDLASLAAMLELPDDAIVTAGGSAYPDLVASVLRDRMPEHPVVIRAGAFQIHDDGFYSQISPLRDRLRSAMHGWARVLSTPEPGIAILDAGKRDLPFDEGLPRVQAIRGRTGSVDAPVLQLNDQHAFVAQPTEGAPLRVGDVVRLGLSHPCTALDKWRLVPLVDDADAAEPKVVGAIDTWF